MTDSITDGTHQMKPPVIDATRTTNHKNDFADTIIYQVFATLNGVSTQIFETDNKDKAQQFVNVINGNTFLTKLQATIKPKYVNHAVIEDGYYTYSHIYENGQTINFTIYNSPITYNTADVINGWMGYVLKFTSKVSHWWYDNHAYAYSADGKDRFTTVYPNLNLLTGTSNQVVQANTWNMQVANIKYDKSLGRTLCASVMINNADHASVLVHGSAYIILQTFDKSGNVLASVDGNQIEYNANGLSQCSISIDDNTANVQAFICTNWMNQNAFYSYLKIEPGSTATFWMPSASEVQPSDYPQFIGTQHTPIGYLHDTPKWYDWQPFTGTEPVENTHTIFDYKVQITDEIEQINQTAPINKRNIRNDNWKYAPNEQYPFIGGYES